MVGLEIYFPGRRRALLNTPEAEADAVQSHGSGVASEDSRVLDDPQGARSRRRLLADSCDISMFPNAGRWTYDTAGGSRGSWRVGGGRGCGGMHMMAMGC